MEPLKYAVGIDCSKEELTVCLGRLDRDQDFEKLGVRAFSNDRQGVGELLEWVRKERSGGCPLQFVIEVTGVYYELAAHELLEHGERISVVLPDKARAFARTLKTKTVTDRTDAVSLARMGAEKKLDQWTPASPVFRELRTLTRERQQLMEDRASVRNQIEAASHDVGASEPTLRRLREREQFLSEQIKEVEQEIREQVREEPWLARKVEKASSIPGVSLITVVTIAAETDGFNLVRNKKQLVSYAGYDIVEKQSGTSVRGRPRISKKGNPRIRRSLHFPAITAVRHVDRLGALQGRITEEKGPKMKGYTAVQRKLLVLIHALWTKEEDFDPDYEHQSEQKEGRSQEETALTG
jgi:transposase